MRRDPSMYRTSLGHPLSLKSCSNEKEKLQKSELNHAAEICGRSSIML